MPIEPQKQMRIVVTFTDIKTTDEKRIGEKDHNFSLGHAVPMKCPNVYF